MSGKRRAVESAGTATRRRPPGRTPKGRGKGKGKGRHPRLRRVVKWLALLALLGLVVLAGVAVVVYRSVNLPAANAKFETETSFIYYADGQEELGQFAIQNRERIPLAQMPTTVKDAVIAIENPTFYTDKGLDPRGILRAAFSNAQGNEVQGGSTITQQYIKVLYLNQERSYTRKIKEAVLSLKIQQQLSKNEILDGYLNTIYFGNGSYGVQAAAKSYFQKPAAELDLRESATLAAVLNNPSLFDPYEKDSKKRLRDRFRLVLAAMVKQGNISPAEGDQAARRLPKFPEAQVSSAYGGQKGHALKLVKDELRALGYSDTEIEGGGLKVTTTFTKKAMDAAEAGVNKIRPAGLSDKELHIGVATVQPGTGKLLGFYGGQDYLDSQINWASAGGMVGSTFKPFSLATALEQGYSLRDTFEGNSPYEFPDGLTVRNEGPGDGNDYGSAVSATTAMEESINTAFVDMSTSMDDGPTKILQTAQRMGVPPVKASKKYPGIPPTSRDLEADALITLGKARISPINMANAFATIANKGARAQVHVIEKVVSRDGRHDYDRSQQNVATTPAMAKDPQKSEDIAADVSYALQRVVDYGTGTNAGAIGRPAAGKTGTATNDKDQVSSSWFVGYTPQLATAVMYVRGDGDDQLDGWLPAYNGAAGYFGSNYPTRTWAAIMQADLEGTEEVAFPEPAYVDGTAPEEGHVPYVPPPAPAPAPLEPAPPVKKPTKQPSEQPTKKPTKAPNTPEPIPVPTPEPPAPAPSNAPPDCSLFSCGSPTPAPSPPPQSPPTASSQPAPARRTAR